MKYFTRKFIIGAWSQERCQTAITGYADYLSALGLSPALRALAQLYLHDAYILAATHDRSAEKLTLRFRHGDLQSGYVDSTILFSQAAIGKKSITLLHDAVRPSNVEVLATELEQLKDCLKFRILLWPKGEAILTFKKMILKSKAVSGRNNGIARIKG